MLFLHIFTRSQPLYGLELWILGGSQSETMCCLRPSMHLCACCHMSVGKNWT